jgi:hypothetical protein|tara:strand:+ start:331 stop:459 length:129 start_codon:yes stop_codon:yes gene_type:complete
MKSKKWLSKKVINHATIAVNITTNRLCGISVRSASMILGIPS